MIIDTTNQYGKYLDKYLKTPNNKILEIGCGKGAMTKHLIKDNHVTVIDPNQDNIEYIKRLYPEIDARIGKGEELIFDDQSFDIVLFGLSFHHTPTEKMMDTLKGVFRILKQDGVLCLIEITNNGSYLKCELNYFDETRERIETHLVINDNPYFGIENDETFFVNWQWDSYQDYYETAIKDLAPNYSNGTERKIKDILNQHKVGNKIIMDTETRIVIGKKKQG